MSTILPHVKGSRSTKRANKRATDPLRTCVTLGCALLQISIALTAVGCSSQKAKLQQLKPGMNYEEAARIMGGPGMELRAEGSGITPGQKVYVWPGKDPGKQVTVIFQDGKLDKAMGVNLGK